METWLHSTSMGEPGFQPKSFRIQIAHFAFAFLGFFFQICIFKITSKIIQTLQKGRNNVLLRPPPQHPFPQAYTANTLVDVLPGHLLCMYRSPKRARSAGLQPDRTAERAEVGLRNAWSSRGPTWVRLVGVLGSGNQDIRSPGGQPFWERRVICAAPVPCLASPALLRQRAEPLTVRGGEGTRGCLLPICFSSACTCWCSAAAARRK